MRIFTHLTVFLAVMCLGWQLPAGSAEAEEKDRYKVEISRDKPVAWWRFNSPESPFASHGAAQLPARATKSVELGIAGGPGHGSIRFSMTPTSRWVSPAVTAW
ncbi:MAG: hypothetical protein CM1200mP2_56190 [Planctomycetaceae bacterium]|nr:MAG: hypothetical protein CM1200mP2_56190 [Planctomycetaceae bacterium]